jgi:hypothetical protein
MQITIENTSRTVEVNGVPARIWEGKTASGIAVQVLVTRIAVLTETENDFSQFEAELEETKPPSAVQAFPLRMVL